MPLPQTEVPGHLQGQLALRGIRMTAQRRAILTVIETASRHLDAAQILRKARALGRDLFYSVGDGLAPTLPDMSDGEGEELLAELAELIQYAGGASAALIESMQAARAGK